jgi:subtilisin family serine protease
MKKNVILFICCTFLHHAFSQTVIMDSVFHLVSTSSSSEKGGSGQLTNNESLNSLFNTFNVTSYEKVYPFAKTPQLHKVYELRCDCEIDSLIEALENYYSNEYSSFRKIEYENVALYEPTDWLWTSQKDGWLWFLKKIQADKAWDITLGNPNVVVGVIDNYFDGTHPDLVTEILLPYDPFDTVPHQCLSHYPGDPDIHHGTSVSILVSGQTTETGNSSSSQLASVGFNTKMLCYKAWAGNYLARALHASTVMGVNILTSSAGGWTSCPDWTGNDQLVVKEILDNGTTIIMPAGNGAGTHNFCAAIDPINHSAFFPLSPYYDERIILVSSTGSDDKHHFVKPNDTTNSTHSHYPDVDLCAPGYDVFVADVTACGAATWPYAGRGHGTSFASPFVAGVASLMYSVNPCLTPSLCQDILKNTTDPILDAQNFPNGVGTGRVNAFKAVKAAQGSYSTGLDLYIKDRPEDFGNQVNPYQWTWDLDESPDIWVRRQNDGLVNQVNQNPEYQSSTPNYVYVRVRNKSCVTSVGTEKVDLHWTKASSLTSWPQNWDGSSPNIGNLIGSNTIGVLEPGDDTILVFTWNILNPYIHQNWASCLMARIVNSSTDIITVHPNHAELDVYLNNNIALRNVTVVDIVPGIAEPLGNINGIYYPNGHYIYVGNPNLSANNFNFTFSSNKNDNLTTYAEVKLIFDEAGWDLIGDEFLNNENFKVAQPREVIVLNDSSFLTNINFPANTRIPVFVGLSFYADYKDLEKSFTFDVRQYSADNTMLLGGEHFEINKSMRAPFSADAGSDKNIDYGDDVTVSAVQISETAIYNWYDPEGNLIHTGKDMTISPEMTKKYKLELIAISDGSISLDEVEITVNKNKIIGISPNPADNFVSVDYILYNVSSSYLMIINQTGTSFNNYVVNPNSSPTYVNLDSFMSGIYTVVLICDGAATDAKQLIIN